MNIKWGIIGCGDVTEVKSGPAYQLIDGFELYAVMRRDESKAKDYANRHNVPKFYSNADDLINDTNVDAVYIATPPDSHKEYALKVAAAGKICCVEKPMAPHYDDCVEMTEAFEKANLPLFVAYYRRNLPHFLKVKEFIDMGKIGAVRQVSWIYSSEPSSKDIRKEYNWRTDKDIAPGGYFDDLASHGLDFFAYVLGDIVKANGIKNNQQGFYTAADSIVACWEHASGVLGMGSWNFGAFENKDEVIITGSKGSIKFSIFQLNPIVLISAEGSEEWQIDHPKHIQYFHVEDMRDHLLGKKQHPSTGATAMRTAWVMDEILKDK